MITGYVNDYGHAMISLRVGHPLTGVMKPVEALIDPAFIGTPLIPSDLMLALQLPAANRGLLAGLADGTEQLLPAFQSRIEWAGQARLVDVISSSNRRLLLGVELLENLALTIDYPARTVTLAPSSAA
jgi:predicted aspartyl protease